MDKRILVIEDQDDINELISLNLMAVGYHTTRCHNGQQGYEQALTGVFDVIVLDIMLPDRDGLQICQLLRAKQITTPILMLTAKKSETDRVVGLEMGADDYLTKPFSVRELQARVKALLRRVAFLTEPEAGANTYLSSGDLHIDKQKRRVRLAQQEITLTAKEFDLLSYMAGLPGQVFSRDQLLSAVWGYQHSGYEHTVNSHINRLRSKLELDPAKPEYVLTVWGVGYKFRER